MSTLKFDAALQLRLQDGDAASVPVSVRLKAPLEPHEIVQMEQLGVQGADARRRVLSAILPPAALASVATMDKVQRVSLAQTVAPLSASIP